MHQLCVYAWFPASAALQISSSFFWDLKRRSLVILYRRFGSNYRYHSYKSPSRPARPRKQHGYHHDTKVKPEAVTAVIELLMMGGRMPETCGAVNKRQDNKLENCCISLVIYLNCTMLHGLTKLKKSDRGFLFSEAVANISLWIRKFYKQI